MNVKYKEEGSEFFDTNIKHFELLIITATSIEKDVLHRILKPYDYRGQLIKVFKNNQTYFLGVFGNSNAIHVACGELGSLGREASIITTMDAISDCKPKIVLMLGIAFGINIKKQKIGDVLISERIIPYEPQRIGLNDIVNRGKEGAASRFLLNRFRNADDWEYLIKGRRAARIFGQILSGEKLIDNPSYKKRLLEDYKEAIGGEMEGAGVYSACDGKVEHWILVKGICDFADGKKRKNKGTNQRIAAESAINLCKFVFNSSNAFKDIELYPVHAHESYTDLKVYNVTDYGDPEVLEALDLYNERISENERFGSEDIIRWLREDQEKIDRNISRDYFFVAKMLNVVCGFTLLHYSHKENLAFIAYLVSKPGTQMKGESITTLLFKEVAKLFHEEDELNFCKAFLLEVDNPLVAKTSEEYKNDIVRIRFFCMVAQQRGFNLRALNFDYKQPLLFIPKTGQHGTEMSLLLMYAAKTVPEFLSNQEVADILNFVYNWLYLESFSEVSEENEQYKRYLADLYLEQKQLIPDKTKLLNVHQIIENTQPKVM